MCQERCFSLFPRPYRVGEIDALVLRLEFVSQLLVGTAVLECFRTDLW